MFDLLMCCILCISLFTCVPDVRLLHSFPAVVFCIFYCAVLCISSFLLSLGQLVVSVNTESDWCKLFCAKMPLKIVECRDQLDFGFSFGAKTGMNPSFIMVSFSVG